MFIIRYSTLVSRLIKYYADSHNVDEDMVSITACGGAFWDGYSGGIALRYVSKEINYIINYVASRKIKCKIHYLQLRG